MNSKAINRRIFLKTGAAAAAGIAFAGKMPLPGNPAVTGNKLPRWKGFNLLDLFSAYPPKGPDDSRTTEDDLKWMSDWGFDFVRIPMAYPRYLSFDRSRDIRKDEILNFDQKVLEEVDNLIHMANKYKMHVSLNLHRGPGYCINAGFHEPFNLWKDQDAQDAFYSHWQMWAERYKTISPSILNFHLLNEQSYIDNMNTEFCLKNNVPGAIYRKVVEGASKVIWAANK